MKKTTQLSCSCANVRLEVESTPIISAECHCNSCRMASERLKNRYPMQSFVEPNGGTRFELYRKDRVRIVNGSESLKEFRLTQTSKTRRVVASCCYTPVFLEFEAGHWLSIYGCMWPNGSLHAPDVRTMTSDLSNSTALSNDVPNAKRQSFKFFAKLLSAWAAMGFRSPKITIVGGTIEV